MGEGKRKLTTAAVAALCIFGPLTAWLAFGQHGFIHLYRVGKERQAYEKRIRNLTQENQALFDEIQRLRTDPKYVEQVARKELGLVRKNEVIYRFSDDDRADRRKPSDQTINETPGKEATSKKR